MESTINSMKELLVKLESIISECEKEIEMDNKFDKFVIIYIPTKENDDIFYGMTEQNINEISSKNGGIKNIIPTPNPSLIKIMEYSVAVAEYKRLKRISNGKGEVYTADIIQYRDYIRRYLKSIKKSYYYLTMI